MIRNEIIPLARLLPDERNPRIHNAENIIRLASRIVAVGFTSPVLVVEDTGILAAGHRRRLALKYIRDELNRPEPDGIEPGWGVPARVGSWSEIQALAVLAGDNGAPDELEYDETALTGLLAELAAQGALESAGYDPDALQALIDELGTETAGGLQGGIGQAAGVSGAAPQDEPEPAADASLLGYAIHRDGIEGRALLDQRKQRGMELVKRLKDAEGALSGEVAFWAESLAAMARQSGRSFDCVTQPPASGKREYSLAEVLSCAVADLLGIPGAAAFTNPAPRGRRLGGVASKLQEDAAYEWVGPASGASILLVDDAYCTGATLGRCAVAAGGRSLFLCVLCRS